MPNPHQLRPNHTHTHTQPVTLEPHVHTHTHMRTHARTHTQPVTLEPHAHTHAHTHTCAHTHAHTHTHTTCHTNTTPAHADTPPASMPAAAEKVNRHHHQQLQEPALLAHGHGPFPLLFRPALKHRIHTHTLRTPHSALPIQRNWATPGPLRP
jgi:hypothetical protein